MHEFDSQFSLDSPTGARLNTYHHAAKGQARGIVHINHGLAEHAARYSRFAHDLSAMGYNVYAHDHRGHGYTKADDAPQGVFSLLGDGVAKVLEDCATVQEHACAAHPDLPLIMFGHSMGGLITMNFLLSQKRDLQAAAVWNSNFDGGILGRIAQLILKYERLRLGSDVPSRILPKLTFQSWAKQIENRRTDFDWLSKIESEVDAYIADPLCGWDASVSLWQDIFKMVFGGSNFSKTTGKTKRLPLMLLAGNKDPATNDGVAWKNQCTRMMDAGFKNIEPKIIVAARHETLNDVESEIALAAFLEFLDQVTLRAD